jgi:mRNA-degrading endonuclease toxin of MazEF toxin-antitoxin module
MPIPKPEPGMVINYSYLWHREHSQKMEEGRKDRPALIVLTVDKSALGMLVTVLPITHSEVRTGAGLELPSSVKRHLGLDDHRSWVVVGEGNEFVWPGHDLRKRKQTDRFEYGFLPPKLFDQIKDAFVGYHQAKKFSVVPR